MNVLFGVLLTTLLFILMSIDVASVVPITVLYVCIGFSLVCIVISVLLFRYTDVRRELMIHTTKRDAVKCMFNTILEEMKR